MSSLDLSRVAASDPALPIADLAIADKVPNPADGGLAVSDYFDAMELGTVASRWREVCYANATRRAREEGRGEEAGEARG